jgi:two-component system, sporulation sensor kinase D
MFKFRNLHLELPKFRFIFILVALGIIITSTFFTNQLAHSLASEEQKKVEIWAEATREMILADENANIEFILSIIETNTSIPVIMTDSKDSVLFARNFKEPNNNVSEFYREQILSLKESKDPIKVVLGDDVQYIYYDESVFLKQLYYFPYVQFGVIITFLLVAFFAFAGTKRAEQNQVWVGLSKETAHQLGTPISSLLAWVDLLKLKYSNEKLFVEMEKDVNRLRTIAERFSKIGSKPDLQLVSLNEVMKNAVQYMSNRTSQKVIISCHYDREEPIFVRLNVHLFEWVVENLCKNAIDAMDGIGTIDFFIQNKSNELYIDVQDIGKGIEKNKYKLVFKPGFTTKKRGWGLGLSLVKRIIEEYHNGKIFIKQSGINQGTTFRIVLYLNS